MKMSRLVAEALLLHGADGHGVVAEGAGHLGQHAGSVAHLDVEVVGGLGVVDRLEHGFAELADGRAIPCGG